MLLFKGWLETRLRLAISFTFVMLFLLFMFSHLPHNGKVPITALTATPNISVIWIVALLAGAGIATQPAFQATKGLHGSMLFTLSLPVSRMRLLAVRATIGWVESAVAIAAFCWGLWLLIPQIRAAITAVDMLEHSGTLIACASALYFTSVLLGTFLDDQWRIWCTMLVAAAFWWLSGRIELPAFADIFRALGKSSPLIVHAMPWPTIAFSLGLSAVLFLAALKVVQTREY